MAATNCLLLELVKKGQKLATQLSTYGGTAGFLQKDFTYAGRKVKFVLDPTDVGDWQVIVDSNTAAIGVEMPSKDRKDVGITESLIRLSCGLEDPADLSLGSRASAKENIKPPIGRLLIFARF